MAGLQQSLVGRLNWFSSALELFTTLISLFQATNTLLPALLLLCFLPLFYTKVRLYRHRPQGNKNKFSSCCETTTLSAAKSLQSCPTLCDPINGSPPGSPVPGTLQAKTLEWVAISFSNAWKWKVKRKSLSWRPHGLQPTRLLRPWDFLGKNTGVGCHCLLWNSATFAIKIWQKLWESCANDWSLKNNTLKCQSFFSPLSTLSMTDSYIKHDWLICWLRNQPWPRILIRHTGDCPLIFIS